jgi:uncharacterized membrane protein
MASPRSSNIPAHVKDAVTSVAELHQRAEDDLNRHQRGVELLTAQLGRPRSLYMIVIAVAGWVGFNLILMSQGQRPIDPPPFQGLQGVITLSALLVATMVLTTQNRQHDGDARRSRLALNVNMLTETEVTKLIALLEELRRDLPNVRNRRDDEAEEMQKPVDPKEIALAMEKQLDENANDGT